MPFHIIHNNQSNDKRSVRRASESAVMLTPLSSGSNNSNGGAGARAGIKEMLQSSLSTTQQHPPAIMINDGTGRSRASSFSLLKRKLGTSATRNSSGSEFMSRGRSGSNDLNPVSSNISMAPTDVVSVISSGYESHQNDQRYERPNKLLSSFLKTQGLAEPVRLPNQYYSKNQTLRKLPRHDLEIHLSNNGNMLLLPYLSSKKFTRAVSEEEEEGGVDDDDDDDGLNEIYETTPPARNSSSSNDDSRSSNFNSLTPLNRINHTFAVIIKLDHKQSLNNVVKAKFVSDCSIDWINGIPDQDSKKTVFNESYKVSKDLVWDLLLDHPDCFIPFEDESLKNDEDAVVDDLKFMDDSESSNTNESGNGKLDNIIISSTPSQILKKLETFNYKERTNIDNNLLDLDAQYQFPHSSSQSKFYDPGYYVFLLPVLFPPIMPETIISPLGKVQYLLSIKIQPVLGGTDLKLPPQAAFSTSPAATNKFLNSPLIPMTTTSTSPMSTSPQNDASPPNAKNRLFKSLKHVGGGDNNNNKKKEENYHEFQFELPVIRQPPPDSITTINKSVYVNKIWNEALNYEITFPKKYVQMSSIDDDIINNFDLKIKIMPLIKKIYMKRIKVNMIEKITYASKNLKYEYDYGKEFSQDKGIKERIIPLFEIKTKEKSNLKNAALRSEVVKHCLDDNLLTTCYEDYKPTKKNNKVDDTNTDETVNIINTVKVTCPLTFYIKNDELVKNIKSNISGGVHNSGIYENDESDNESITSLDSSSRQQPKNSPTSSFINMLSKSPLGGNHSSSTPQIHKKDDWNHQIKDKYGLYPDVSGFGNINIKHRLQICFRISKPEPLNAIKPGDDVNKLHHYEVIIDTPIVLNSPFANDNTPPSYSEISMTNDQSQFQIRPIYQDQDDVDAIGGDGDDDIPPPPFEFNIGSPINGSQIQSDFNSNENELLSLPPHSIDDVHSSPSYHSPIAFQQLQQQQQQQQQQQPSPNIAPSTTIDELLILENNNSNKNNSDNNKSNLSRLLLSNQPPPEYSQIDQIGNTNNSTNNSTNNNTNNNDNHFTINDEDELDIGGENYINEDDIMNHDSYNKKRIQSAKRQNHILMRKIEDDLGDFSF